MKTLSGKTIVVVGATGGIGRVFSKFFHEEGANVVMASRTKEKLEKLQKAIGVERSMIVETDATMTDSVFNLFNQTIDKFKAIDAVVISAGSWERLSSNNSAVDAKRSQERLFGSIYLPTATVAFVAQEFMKKQGSGLIANISSHAAIRPELQGNLSYGPMKAAARHFMLSLREELKNTGVLVTDIQPAIVNTDEAHHLLDTEEKRKKAVQPETIALWISDQIDRKKVPGEKLFDSDVVL
jgi:NADP-dependent 3-hydroxy acid dehydrogenase YdfG